MRESDCTNAYTPLCFMHVARRNRRLARQAKSTIPEFGSICVSGSKRLLEYSGYSGMGVREATIQSTMEGMGMSVKPSRVTKLQRGRMERNGGKESFTMELTETVWFLAMGALSFSYSERVDGGVVVACCCSGERREVGRRGEEKGWRRRMSRRCDDVSSW